MQNADVAQILDSPAPVESKIPTVEPTTTPKPDDKVSSRIGALIQREQSALARERQAKAREVEVESKLAKFAEFESVKTNPKKALELLGLNYDELTRSILSDGELPPDVKIKKVEDKFDAYKREQESKAEEFQKEQLRQAEARENQVVTNFKSEITTYLTDNIQRYELIDFEAQQDLVFEVIDEHYNRTINPETGSGKVMSIAEAADKVEQHLEQKYNKSKGLAKVKALWETVPKAAQVDAVKAASQSPQRLPPKTLTNQLASSPSLPRKVPISDEERVQKAIAYARGLRT